MIIFSSCQQSVQQKAETAVREHLKKTLNDPSSYEAVDFGKVDSVYKTVDSTTLLTLRILHSYRAKNSFGALVLQTEYFKLMPMQNNGLYVYY